MRKALGEKEGERRSFQATFVRFGSKRGYQGYKEETILLKNIIDVETNKIVADHSWFNFTKSFQTLNLTEGIQIRFDARIKEYRKGYVNRRYGIDNSKKDYRLSHPTNVSIATVSTETTTERTSKRNSRDE
jgi:hypothetical protein